MHINILSFGQVATITGNSVELNLQVADTNELQQALQHKFPQLAGVKYAMAVDRKMVHENVALANGSTVALLPPFSGG